MKIRVGGKEAGLDALEINEPHSPKWNRPQFSYCPGCRLATILTKLLRLIQPKYGKDYYITTEYVVVLHISLVEKSAFVIFETS